MPFYATRFSLWVCGTATLLLMIILIVVFAPLGEKGGIEIIALQFSFTPDRFFPIVHRWGEGGVALFRSRMWLDYLFPVFYSFLLAGLAFRKTGKRMVVFIPFSAALLDFMENAVHLNLLETPDLFSATPPVTPFLILLASLLATAKWSCIAASLSLFVWPKRR